LLDLPVGVVLPARWAELARAHDLGADARIVLLGERVVDAGGALRPKIGVPKRVANIHATSRWPACPMGASGAWPSPVAKEADRHVRFSL
jgi:hypothetical protein